MKIDLNFTIINHIAREELGLSWMEYGLADLIYHLSSNSHGDYPGWCYATKEKLSSSLKISSREIYRILIVLEVKGLIEKHESTKHIRTTEAWYNKVIIKDTDKLAVPMTNWQSDTDKLAVPIYNNDNNNDKKYIKRFNELFDTRYQPTTGRKKQLNLRLKNFTLEEILTALEKLAASKFHRGNNDRGWIATPDFLLRSDEKIDEWMNKSGKKKDSGFELSQDYKVYKG